MPFPHLAQSGMAPTEKNRPSAAPSRPITLLLGRQLLGRVIQIADDLVLAVIGGHEAG
jgi:hypothetical protein